MRKVFQILREERGMSTTTEMIILIAVIAVIAGVVGTTMKEQLNNGATNTGTFINDKFTEAQGGDS